ncbi:unnamed protein product [Adineta ricciae]|uniref:CUB domain-containing protein n=1 Tax=Adineta ricciae TaxID=249248 RepID=A0A814CEB2_ADIRI|nr:unnamed protein product [Adineta ricciae]
MATKAILLFSCILIVTISIAAAKSPEKYYMDKMCGGDVIILDGDNKPGIALQLTSSSKYKPNMNCVVKFRTAQPSQRLVVTVEKMDITDCAGDSLRIYDGTTLLNKDVKQQCGSSSVFTYTTASTQLSLNFASNAAIESSGYQMTVALDFPMIAACPQNLGFFLCKNRNCISKQLSCDGRNHCGDATDENQCSFG